MPVEMAIWRMTEAGPTPIAASSLEQEKRLEDMIAADPSLTGIRLLLIGRQVATEHGGLIDLLAVDEAGRLHVLELKRDKTPRDVVAQVLDYGSWVQGLGLAEVSAIYARYVGGNFDEAFAQTFDSPVPEVLNAEHQLTVVASAFDAASERIVAYLAEGYGVPVNAVFFRHFSDGDSDYLARTWLLDPEETQAPAQRTSARRKAKPWNGRDFYVVLGTTDDPKRWTLGLKYGFAGAGGGSWYWKPLRNLQPEKRIFAYVGGAGYVGVGEVTGPMQRLADLKVDLGAGPVVVVDQPDVPEDLRRRALSLDEEVTEYAVPVQWIASRQTPQAVKEPGVFASQVTVCRLTDERTIEIVTKALGIAERDDRPS